ncbi:MAG: sulfite exporter TauE/SafE family protein [Candidatus Omnitrophica bacterium]|nr:sulfite exporter TauE/SafE family protein [Candidatus Omnitrophota bacterium]
MHISGTLLDYLLAFGSGVLVSFTPCVYPVLPMTATFIAGMNSKGSKWFGFLISLVYVFGMALTYSAFAVFAALSGKIFGQLQNNPIIFIIVANIILIFAFVMLDIIHLPHFGKNTHKKRPQNLWAVLLFGMSSGLVVGPCTAPALGTLLAYVASKQNIVNGVFLVFVFAYGVGASLILVGTFSGLLASLPKSGRWLLYIKRFCALILIIVAEYFLIKAGSFFF